MKALLLHGPAKIISRNRLLDEKNKFNPESIDIFEEGSSNQEILSSMGIVSMFSQDRAIILENPSEDFVPTTRFARSARRANYQLPTTLLIWFDHEVSDKRPIVSWFKQNKGQILFFPEGREISIFPFLDMLANGDKKAFIELDKLKESGFDIQYLITMTYFLLRNLTVTPKNAPQFVKEKLTRQGRNFNLEKITHLYKDILEIDFKIKSGLLQKDHAEFLLIKKFIN